MQVISSKFFFCVWSICDDTMTHLSTLGDWWPLYTWDFGLSSWCAIVFCGLVYSCTELQHSILCVSPLAGNDITRKHLWKANNSQIPIPTPFSQSQSVQWTLSPLICKSPIYPPMVKVVHLWRQKARPSLIKTAACSKTLWPCMYWKCTLHPFC